MSVKLNVLLAKTDHLAASFRENLTRYIKYFKEKAGEFRGFKKTYTPKENVQDDPSKRGTSKIIATVDDKLKWLKDTHSEYINSLFAQEATNAAGVAKAELIVEGVSWGILSSLELLRLKSLLEGNDVKGMYESIPVRDDSKLWETATNEMYTGLQGVFESPVSSGTSKSIVKTQFILPDPNVGAAPQNYKPTVSQRDEILELGDYTLQEFTAEWSSRQRADLLKRRETLLVAVITAIKVANEVEAKEAAITAEKLFDYLHSGTNA